MYRRGVFVTLLVVALVGVGPANPTVGGDVSDSVATGTAIDVPTEVTAGDSVNVSATVTNDEDTLSRTPVSVTAKRNPGRHRDPVRRASHQQNRFGHYHTRFDGILPPQRRRRRDDHHRRRARVRPVDGPRRAACGPRTAGQMVLIRADEALDSGCPSDRTPYSPRLARDRWQREPGLRRPDRFAQGR